MPVTTESGTRISVALYFCRLGQAGGAERMLLQLAGALAKRGFDVHLLSLDEPGTNSYYPISGGSTWHRLSDADGLSGKASRVANIVRILNHNRIRVLIGFVMSGDKTIYAAAKFARVSLVAAERNGPSMYALRYSAGTRLLTFGLLHLCDAITVQFPRYKLGYPATLHSRIMAIPNPVEVRPLRASPDRRAANGRFCLLSISRLDREQKGLDTLLRAFRRISSARPDWDLKLVGNGAYEAELRRLISELGLMERVTIDPPTQCVENIYKNANLFVLPSRWEGFPNALAESLAAGLPAVGFRVEGVSDLIIDGATGWLAGPGNATESLAEVLLVATADASELQRRGTEAVRSMQIYATDAPYDQWARLIEQLAGDAHQ